MKLKHSVHYLHTDASFDPQTKKGYYCFIYLHNVNTAQILSASIPVMLSTSVDAEIYGAISGLEQILRLNTLKPKDHIVVYCDCKALDCINNVEQGAGSNTFKQNLLSLVKHIQGKYQTTIEYQWVKGHSNEVDIHSILNKFCDSIATKSNLLHKQAMNHYEKNIAIKQAVKASKKEVEVIGLIYSKNRIMFSSLTSFCTLFKQNINKMKQQHSAKQVVADFSKLRKYLLSIGYQSMYQGILLKYHSKLSKTALTKQQISDINQKWDHFLIEYLLLKNIITLKQHMYFM